MIHNEQNQLNKHFCEEDVGTASQEAHGTPQTSQVIRKIEIRTTMKQPPRPSPKLKTNKQ